jgi:hypothetical protein
MSIIKSGKNVISEVTAAETPMLTPEEFIEQVRALRARVPDFVHLPKTRATRQLRRAAGISIQFAREAFGAVGASPVVQEAIGNTPAELHQADDEVARWTSAEGELEALLRGVAAANIVRRQRIAQVALQSYNVSRELVKQEEHAHLLPYVERMKRMPKYGRRRKPAEPAQPQPAAPPAAKP